MKHQPLGQSCPLDPESALTLTRGLAPNPWSAPPATGGLNFKLSMEQQELVNLAEKFTKDEVIPMAAHYD